ncbi:hypothetical protein FOA22_12555 [Heyndrickxia oleronia]|uniref:hypothetical protein n=1 Tax=Heyndrickxia oleronia TaxID=38875 RepID=UPI00333D0BA2
MELWKYVRSKVKIIYKDGDELEGFVTDYIDGEDNEDGIDSLVITNDETKKGNFLYEVTENEIQTIEIID